MALTDGVKYLILQEEYFDGRKISTITPCTCLTTAFEIAKNSKRVCTLYERRGASHEWTYVCDISVNLI